MRALNHTLRKGLPYKNGGRDSSNGCDIFVVEEYTHALNQITCAAQSSSKKTDHEMCALSKLAISFTKCS
jgi:hypothetical protein